MGCGKEILQNAGSTSSRKFSKNTTLRGEAIHSLGPLHFKHCHEEEEKITINHQKGLRKVAEVEKGSDLYHFKSANQTTDSRNSICQSSSKQPAAHKDPEATASPLSESSQSG